MAKKKKRAKGSRRATARGRRECGAMAPHMMLLEKHPGFRTAQLRLEVATARRRATALDTAKLKLITIKTVVHVVYRTAQENISLAQIKSQLKVLNQDFRATNPDRTKTPVPFKGLIGDTRVAFKLVKVTRTKTTKTSFGTNDGIKKASTGGIPPESPKSRLNIWVGALTGGLLGYAQFPGGPPSTDGVVVDYRAFGTMGTAQAPFNKGRTGTHEVGHYLNLRHIWGDTPDCSGGDAVADTPNCAGPNYGSPAWPVITCNNGPNGDMFMNYMDYVNDAAMFMFSRGQVVRMRTALDTVRKGLK